MLQLAVLQADYPPSKAALPRESNPPDPINPQSDSPTSPEPEHGLTEDALLHPLLSFDKIVIGGLIRHEIPASRQNCRTGEAPKEGKYCYNYQDGFNFLVKAAISFLFLLSCLRRY